MLPQLAVSAKILCLLMVVICGAVHPIRMRSAHPTTERSVYLFSHCAHHYVKLHSNNSVLATSEETNLTLSSENSDLQLLIHSPRENMYMCFTRGWRLLGRRITREKARNDTHCQFYEELTVEGYNRYRSVSDKDRYIGFNYRGLPMRRPMSFLKRQRWINPQKRSLIKCLNFLKKDHGFDIEEHNLKVAGEKVRRSRQPPQQNALRPPCRERLRHRRRKICGT